MPAPIGKPDRTGRSSGVINGRRGRNQKPPPGEPWVWLTRELLCSPAWCAQSINCRRLMDFLLVEHMNHAGQANGQLMATYDQLAKFGLTRSQISSAILEAENLGLCRTVHGGKWAGSNQPSRYTLNFYWTPADLIPENNWRRVTAQKIEAFRSAKTAKKRVIQQWRKNQKSALKVVLP